MRAGDAPPLPVAWLALDEGDSDLVLFLRYFIAALRTIVPGACAGTAEMLAAAQEPPPEVVGARLSNEIAHLPGPFVLALDDFHTIQGEAVPDFLSTLVRHWPPPLRLVLMTRLDPSLPVAHLRARGQVVEVRAHELRFTREETAAYLSRALPARLSASAVDLLNERTDGWIAGLHLASLSLRAGEDPETLLASLSGSDFSIADYLVDQVLAKQPADVQTFLLRTAILERFCVSLSEAVVGCEEPACNARACIDWVERANLFVIPLDGRREWYRYHHLFRDLLLQRLLAEASADQVAELHGRAAAWFAGRDLTDEALRHALAANDLDLAVRLAVAGLQDRAGQG